MITLIDDFYTLGCGRCARFATAECSVQRWRGGLLALRGICLGLGLDEVVKWGHPCFMQGARNIALIGALRDDFRLSFMNAALLTDPDGILEKSGPNCQNPDMIRFTANDQPEARQGQIVALLTQAIGFAKAGIKAPRGAPDVTLPEMLITALEDDPELAEAFFALTPGRQRSYVILVNGAKALATKQARIAKYRDHILAGKGALERG